MDLELADRVAFIAGSSRGIGRAVARAFVSEGAKVVITGRDADSLLEAKSSLSEASGPDAVHAIRCDMTEPGEIRSALSETTATFGGIDAVVANVGSGTARGGWELDSEDWQSSLSVNLHGSMALASEAMPHLIGRDGATVTFISSIAGIEAIDAPLPYGAAKAAIQSAMKSLSRLAGAEGVRVNAVAPGNILFPGGTWEQKLADGREFFENYIETEVPLRRFGRPEDIADAVVFLASRRASFITGACLVVDGGQTRSFA